MARSGFQDFKKRLLLVAAAIVYFASVAALEGRRSLNSGPELAARLPLAAQVILAGGDRFLAANLAGFRVLVADTFRMKPGELEVQAQLQKDISWLNPAHEDNYYIAAAILSEPRLIPAAQLILRRAADARPRDWTPLFYFAFNRFQFEKDPAGAAASLLEGVGRANDVGVQLGLQALAARWIERGYQTSEAARIVGQMAESTPHGGFRRYMRLRAERLSILDGLNEPVAKYTKEHGKPPESIERLVEEGFLSRVPVDPMGIGFAINSDGQPVFRDRLQTGSQ